MPHEDAVVEVHEEPNLVERPAPVLRREGVHREPIEAELERALDGVEQRLLPRGVSFGALQALAASPTGHCRPSPRQRAPARDRDRSPAAGSPSGSRGGDPRFASYRRSGNRQVSARTAEPTQGSVAVVRRHDGGAGPLQRARRRHGRRGRDPFDLHLVVSRAPRRHRHRRLHRARSRRPGRSDHRQARSERERRRHPSGSRRHRRAQPQDRIDRGPRRSRLVVTRRRAGHSARGRSRVAGEGRGDRRPGEGARMAARNRSDDRGNHRRHRADRVGAARLGRSRS